jgi:hypothetical protein
MAAVGVNLDTGIAWYIVLKLSLIPCAFLWLVKSQLIRLAEIRDMLEFIKPSPP